MVAKRNCCAWVSGPPPDPQRIAHSSNACCGPRYDLPFSQRPDDVNTRSVQLSPKVGWHV
eukprot:7202279-Pyramimonas_sp.AAC.1